MTSKQKAEIKKVLIEMRKASYNRGTFGDSNVHITPYLERIVKIMEEK